jgi:GNAT superfamily N-acetyltransferase
MNDRELACLVEGSEAAAYASLVAAPTLEIQEHYGLTFRIEGSALAVLGRTLTSSLNLNRIIGLGVMEPASEQLLDSLMEFYVRHGLSFAVELSPRAKPQQLVEWLRARRLRKVMATAMHYRVAGSMVATTSGIRVVQARPEDCNLVANICCAVFKMPASAHAAISAANRLPQWRHWLAYDEAGSAVAAALSFVEHGVGWLGWDATLPEGRGRGAHTALIAARVTDAARVGCGFVTAETALRIGGAEDPSRRNYRRSGFIEAYERATYVHRHTTTLPSVD